MRLPGILLRATMFALVSPMCAAQSYPAKPVRIIVPQPAGSTPDLVARLIAPGLSTLFGQQFIIDNRGGAGGMIGTEIAARATPDGYTLVVGTPGTLTIMQHVQKNVPYEAFTWFGLLAPARTPKDILNRLSKALPEIMRTPETRSQFERQGVDPAESSPDKLLALIRHETEVYGKLVKLSGMKVDRDHVNQSGLARLRALRCQELRESRC